MLWYPECLRDKGKVEGCQLGLVREAPRPREMVDFLLWFEATPHLMGEGIERILVGPHHIPVLPRAHHCVTKPVEHCDHMTQWTILFGRWDMKGRTASSADKFTLCAVHSKPIVKLFFN